MASLFKKMRVKAALLPNGNGNTPTALTAPPTPLATAKKMAPLKKPMVPRNQAKANILAAVGELNEILAGRKEALTLDEFWAEMKAEAEAEARQTHSTVRQAGQAATEKVPFA